MTLVRGLLSNALKSLNLNRSPGLDGLTAEFYLHFWDVLAPLLLCIVNECFLRGYLPDLMKGSVTRLIFRRRGDRKCLKNWCPISLLNVDYKIFSKFITFRLSKVLSFIIHQVLLFIKPVPYLVVLFFLMSLSYEIPSTISSVRMRRQFL